MEPNLEPCPFCGSKAEIFTNAATGPVDNPKYTAYVECMHCSVRTQKYIDEELDGAINWVVGAWNQRVDAKKYPTSEERKLYKKLAENASTIGFHEGFLEGIAMHTDEVSHRIRLEIEKVLRERKVKSLYETDDSVADR